MTDLRDAAKLALKVLENKCDHDHEAIAALKRAIANDAMDRMAENARELGLDYEPHMDWCASLTRMLTVMPPRPAPCNCKTNKDYARGYVAGMDSKMFASDTSQEHVDKVEEQRHEWVGLTDEERRELRKRNQQHDALMLATEKLLKEKNT